MKLSKLMLLNLLLYSVSITYFYAGSNNNINRLIEDRKLVQKVNVELYGKPLRLDQDEATTISSVAFSPDGKYLAVGSDKGVTVYDLNAELSNRRKRELDKAREALRSKGNE